MGAFHGRALEQAPEFGPSARLFLPVAAVRAKRSPFEAEVPSCRFRRPTHTTLTTDGLCLSHLYNLRPAVTLARHMQISFTGAWAVDPGKSPRGTGSLGRVLLLLPPPTEP